MALNFYTDHWILHKILFNVVGIVILTHSLTHSLRQAGRQAVTHPPLASPPVLLQEYIHHLIFERLGDGSIVEVLKKLMKLPWDEAEPYLLKCLLKVNGGGGGGKKN